MKKKGDMVWVRFHHFPHKCLPALVLSSDNLGVNVTFSFTQNDAVSPSSYFLHSQVLPFEQAFPFLAKRDEADLPLLHSALRFFGRRIVSGLQCRCLTGFNGPVCSSGFDPAGVLGFVLDAAVSPSVELPSFAHAVRVVAQVHAFRSCCSMKHKKLYKQTKISGDNVKLIPSSVLGQKMHLVTQESVALESQEKCQIVSKHQQSKKVIGAIKRLNSTVPVWEGNSAQLFKNGPLIISESFMVCPSLDPLYMVLESLKSSRHSLLGFKKIPDRGLVDICFENFSSMSKTHILVPSNFMIHLRNFIDKIEDNVQELCWRLPDKEIIISLNRKRRRLDKSASCHVFPQMSGVQESESDAYIPKHTRPRISDIKMLEPEGSIQKGNEASTYVCEDDMNLTGNDKVQKVESKRSQNCELLSILVFGFDSDKCEVDASEREMDAYIPKHTRPRISDIKMPEPEGSIQKGNEASTYVCETNMNFTDNDKVQKVDSKRSQNCELLSNLVFDFHSVKCEVDASESDAYIPKHTRPRISDIEMPEPERSIQKGNEASTYVCETNMNFTDNDKVQKGDSKRSQNCELLSNLVFDFHSVKCEVDASESDAYIPKHTRPRISDITVLEPEGSIQKGNEASTYVCEDTMNFTGNDKVQKVDSKRSQNCELLSNLVFDFHSVKCEIDASESDAYIPKHTRPRISDIKMLEPEGSIQKGNEASTYVCEDTVVNFTGNDKVQKVDSKRTQNCELLSNLVFGFLSDKCEVDASAAKGKGMLGSDSSVYQESQQMSCLVEGKDRFQGVASCSIFNSKVGKSSKTHVPSSSKSLLMKFPRNFNLPSKEQLVKMFSVFGSVDSSRTKVFCYGASAQVCFLQEADTVVAYKYAKRKSLFGTAKVRFWLDPFEHKRRGFECSAHVPSLASKQSGPPLKSCLKKANTLRKENKKKKRRVRFTIET